MDWTIAPTLKELFIHHCPIFSGQLDPYKRLRVCTHTERFPLLTKIKCVLLTPAIRGTHSGVTVKID